MTAVIAAPLRVEQAALRPARTPVIRTGMGPRRSRNAANRLGGAVVVAGVGGGLTAEVRVGDVVVATEVRGPSTVACPSAPILAAALRRLSLRVHCGPIASSPTLVRGNERRRWGDALAVDMESAWLAPVGGSPFAVERAISDGVGSPLARPAVVVGGWAALRSLRVAVPALDAWAAAIRPREILLGGAALAHDCDLVLVAGSAGSANARQLVGAAPRHGTRTRLVQDAADLSLDDLAKAARVGLIAEASAPPRLVGDLIDAMAGLGPLTVREHDGTADSPQTTRLKEVN